MDKKKAGSHSGICLLHLLWKLPFVEAHGKLEGIACPLELLCTIPADKGQGVHLFHYERDLLCCWQPTIDFIQCAPSRLRRDRLRFTSAVSHQDQWWSSCACALHLLAREMVHSDAQPTHLLLPTPYLCVTHTTLFCPPFFPQRHLVTSIHSMAHGAVIMTFLVASRYRYTPNTLGRKRS